MGKSKKLVSREEKVGKESDLGVSFTNTVAFPPPSLISSPFKRVDIIARIELQLHCSSELEALA